MVCSDQQLPKARAGAACGWAHDHGTVGDAPIAGGPSDEFAAYAFHRIRADNICGRCLLQAEFWGGKLKASQSSTTASKLGAGEEMPSFVCVEGSEAFN